MAKHIQHIHTNDAEHLFSQEELLIGELGLNIKTGTISMINEENNVIDFINKSDIQTSLYEIETELSSEINGLDDKIDSNFATTQNAIQLLDDKIESIEDGVNKTIDSCVATLNQEITNVNTTITTQINNISGEFDGRLDALELAISDDVSNSIAGLEEQIESVQNAISNEVNTSIAALEATLEETQKTITEGVNTSIESLNQQITDVQTTITTEVNASIAALEENVETNKQTALSALTAVDSRVSTLEAGENIEGLTKVLTSHDEPSEEYRDDYLWIQETDDEIIEDDFQTDIRAMQKAIVELTKIVQRHEYAFNNTMNCGTVTDHQNTRETLMASATPEAPDDYFDSASPMFICEMSADDEIQSITNHYLATTLSYDVEIETDGWHDVVLSFDETNKYLWNYKTVLFASERTNNSAPQLIMVHSDARNLDTLIDYYAVGDSMDEYPSKKDGDYNTVVPAYDETKPYLWSYIKPEYLVDTSLDKPEYDGFGGANVKHLIIKSANTEQEIRDNFANIVNGELIWCEGNNGLYIRSNNKLVKINGTSGYTPGEDNEIDEIMSGITTSGSSIAAIEFISPKGAKYTMKVNDEGELLVYNDDLNQTIAAPTGAASGTEGSQVGDLFLPKLYINSVYCGGVIDDNGKPIDEHSMNPCSHNFVELSNLTTSDINLNGLSLQYAASGTDWKVLPLWGKIKAGSTFLIRGAQCSIMNHNTTVIKVKDYDMEWRTDDGSLMKFDNKSAKFYLTYGTTKCSVPNPYFYNATDPTATTLTYGYIDLVGLASDATHVPGGQENKVYSFLNSKRLFKKYYSMDNVSQATKAKDKRNNQNDWYYIDLTRDDILPNVEYYTPRPSSYGKNIFYDKTAMKELKPTIATITFGIQATDKEDGNGATRCFTWVSKGYYDEYLWYRKKNASSGWTRVESFKDLTGDIDKHYNRIQQEATNGDVFTTHKLIVKGLTHGTYEYICGKSLKSGEPNMEGCIEREFTVRTDNEVNNGFSFIQVSDQQGFNWDEYQVWRYTAKYISENHTNAHFMVNTGDMTQNGNRLNEWMDYFNSKEGIDHMEEMATIGNNDLCPKVVYELGDGGDAAKINYANINFFYTFEIDEKNPTIFSEGYIPSIYSFNYGNTHFICLNSEISEKTETDILDISNNSGIIYDKIKEWCERDIDLYGDNSAWKIAYCHEMPFTIITDGVMGEFYTPGKNGGKEVPAKNNRGGSRINTNTKTANKYWFSQFCQNNDIRLVMGGHKHTQAISWPLKENVINGEVNSMKPIIQVTAADLSNHFEGSTKLITIEDSSSDLNGQKFPNKWFVTDYQDASVAQHSHIQPTYERNCHFCTFELVSNITAPVYSMSQATGYKHTSNKELPAAEIPWCRYYYPNVVDENGKVSVNTEQRYPFYSIYTVSPNKITIDVKRIKNVLVNGKFNINDQGEALKNNTKTVTVDNGLSPDHFKTTEQVTITK